MNSFFGLLRRDFTRKDIEKIAAGVAEKLTKHFGELK